MSSPENIVEDLAEQQKLFIFGVIHVSGNYIDDNGFYMFDLERKQMCLVPIRGK